MDLDGKEDNAFPWIGNPAANRDHLLPMSPGIPHTPGIPMNPGLLSPGYFAGAPIPRTPGISGYPSTPGIPSTPSSGHGDPPRPPREGFEWVWFPEGFWAERELGETSSPHKGDKFRRWKKSSSNKSQSSNDYSDQAFPLPSPRRGSGGRRGSGASVVSPQPHIPHTSFKTERDLIQSLQSGVAREDISGESASPMTPISNATPEGSVQGSSPSSTIRGFRRGSWPEGGSQGTPTIPEEREEDAAASQGSLTPLSRWKSVGKGKDKRKARSQEAADPVVIPRSEPDTSRKDEQSNARKWFNKVPWRKKEAVHEAPILSQIEEEPYVSKRFWSAAYPGGEARRVTTPPLKEAAEGKVRSLFSEVDNFADGDHIHSRSEGDNRSERSRSLVGGDGNSPGGGTGTETASSSSTKSSSRFNAAYRKAASPEGKVRHWFDQMSEDDDRHHHHRKQKEKKEKVKRRADFHIIPEHLPSSPLCPANPKHPSGGNGVCVYHGRKHEINKLNPFRAELGMLQPGNS